MPLTTSLDRPVATEDDDAVHAVPARLRAELSSVTAIGGWWWSSPGGTGGPGYRPTPRVPWESFNIAWGHPPRTAHLGSVPGSRLGSRRTGTTDDGGARQ